MRAFYTLCLVVTLFYLVSSCELQTHYWEDGKCCKMCGPGKRMLRSVNCEDPICPFCDEGEYQSGYTSETRCKLQPSCDTNLNFLPQTKPIPKDRLSKCQCKPGYYCTEDDDCSTCRKHKICKAGEKILKNGTSVSNTVCEACKSGTFSISDSSNICKEWTTCEPGYDEKTQGSLRSDRICEKGTPSDRGAIVGGVIGILLLLLAGVGVVIFIKKRPFEWKKIPKEAVRGTRLNLNRENQPIIDPAFIQQPQEDVEDTSPVSPTSNITENGNFVTQEEGKHSICPSTETQRFSESSSL
ncbi:tumor necrosis factor receptor superfamily member 5 isoform X2 [Triplophysa rosa]|uniref:tumor necrosis factor receptor superfamily member 5 isoform X2 n=1 Tax=Triplophysa rosa TaxID=992332 RepID=UPI0025462BFD|nr:tumor necrosis factor receptor superfamily member 5 isoform X2 [Triplophysa rosa]